MKFGDKVYYIKSNGMFEVDEELIYLEDSNEDELVCYNYKTKRVHVVLKKSLSLYKKLPNKNHKKSINEYCIEAYEIAKSKGWHDEEREMGTILALIHGEVSEAMEADRKNDTDNFKEELADIVIRVFDLCGLEEIDLEAAINKKMEYNKTRSYKHGNKKY